jgi:hypothetical protein
MFNGNEPHSKSSAMTRKPEFLDGRIPLDRSVSIFSEVVAYVDTPSKGMVGEEQVMLVGGSRVKWLESSVKNVNKRGIKSIVTIPRSASSSRNQLERKETEECVVLQNDVGQEGRDAGPD